MAIRDFNSRFMFSSDLRESWKVLGSMFGNIFSAKGRANSINGMRINIENGTRRNKSVTVLSNCFRSLLVKVEPCNVLPSKLLAVRTSAIKSYTVDQRRGEWVKLDKIFENIQVLLHTKKTRSSPWTPCNNDQTLSLRNPLSR